MRRKKEKLVIISPSGKEYELGFLSPCKEGFVLGASEIQGVNTSHLTVLSKRGLISAHITPQYHGDREYFSPITKKELVRRCKSLLDSRMLSPLTKEQLSQNIVYVTNEFLDLLDSFRKAIYQQGTTRKEKIHILNFKRLTEKTPELFKKMTAAPQSLFGMCKAEDLLKDKSKIAGMTDSKVIVFRQRRKLYGVDFSTLMAFDFLVSERHAETRSPLREIYESFGIPQYMQKLEKRFFEKLLEE